MSNDEYKTSLLNYNRFYFQQATNNKNNYCSSNINSNYYNSYQTVFPLKQSDKNSGVSKTAPSAQKSTYQTEDVNDKNNTSINNYNTNNNNINIKIKTSTSEESVINSNQFVPMNLITNTGLDLSHSIRRPSFTTYYNSDLLALNNNSSNNNSYVSSPSSSTSASIDVENDDNEEIGERIMSPVSIPSHQQKSLLNDTRNISQSAFTNMELTAGSIPAGFPLNYQQLYANNAALYGAPVMFSGAIHAAHASYMAGLPLHAALSPNETYLKAIQAAACGIYSPTALAPPPPPPPVVATSTSSASVNPALISGKLSSLHNNTTGSSMMALAPSSQPVAINKSPQQHHQQQQYSPNIASSSSSLAEVEQQHQHQQQKKDYHVSPLNSQTPLRLSTNGGGNCNNNGTGTYLNDKVNERVTGVDATKDSHFKVPNGKEGSLKHRILRPPSNSENVNEHNRTPVMRAYISTSNFKKGNYIELANGALRRVEDMRTEDFIQCAERSPHHQLAESTVVKINTSLPTTAVITFSYDRNRSKVDMEVSLDHPFFVYGQGWASCNPEMSMKMFGLKCQRLQVGDICISLTKREPSRQAKPPVNVSHLNQNSSVSQYNEALNYQRRPNVMAVTGSNAANLKSPSIPTMSTTAEIPYANAMNAHAFSMPVPQSNHHLQQQQQQQQQHHHHHQVQQQAYAEMAKLVSSYAYAKGLPQLPHEQLKEVVMDAAMLQNLPPKMMSAFYQNQIFQLAQQQHQQQEHLRQAELKNQQQKISNSHYSPQPADMENNHSQQQQPPQTQPLDVTMSRKRRWSAPENMFDDDESATQPPRNGSSPATARS